MKDIELFSKLLGLEEPWKIRSIKPRIEEKEIIVEIIYPSGIKGKCRKCGKECTQYDHPKTRQWRHLDTMQFKTILECAVPRIKCEEHGVLKMNPCWAEGSSRFTKLFERFAIDVLNACKTNQKAGELLQISWDEMHYIKEKAVERGLRRRELEGIEYIGIDEKSFLKGHDYATVLTDLNGGRVLDVVRERTEETAREIINRNFSKEQKKRNKSSECRHVESVYECSRN